jgi:SAM-dependent methyltransferase
LSLFDEEYDRSRQCPEQSERIYVHLKDLVDALRPRLESAKGEWLDFGSATSPYRVFMPNAHLQSADVAIEETANLPQPDFVIEPGRPCPAGDESFDGILSTQVLEHLPDPGFYLRDAFRMLRPGGELLVTTHGTWQDHPLPLDLYRWTAQGLQEDISRAGFAVTECLSLTCGVRAALLLIDQELDSTTWWGKYLSVPGALLGALRLIGRRRPRWLNRFSDHALPGQSIVQDGRAKLYLGLLVSARKPART